MLYQKKIPVCKKIGVGFIFGHLELRVEENQIVSLFSILNSNISYPEMAEIKTNPKKSRPVNPYIEYPVKQGTIDKDDLEIFKILDDTDDLVNYIKRRVIL